MAIFIRMDEAVRSHKSDLWGFDKDNLFKIRVPKVDVTVEIDRIFMTMQKSKPWATINRLLQLSIKESLVIQLGDTKTEIERKKRHFLVKFTCKD